MGRAFGTRKVRELNPRACSAVSYQSMSSADEAADGCCPSGGEELIGIEVVGILDHRAVHQHPRMRADHVDDDIRAEALGVIHAQRDLWASVHEPVEVGFVAGDLVRRELREPPTRVVSPKRKKS